MNNTQYQVISRPRHFRYIYFIDENYSYDLLLELIYKNQGLWGGRYNPIIPVINKTISSSYISLCKYYDPDIVYYSNTIDLDYIKKLKIFNPSHYIPLSDEPWVNHVKGVSSIHLLSQFGNDNVVLVPINLYQIENPLKDFYKLNYGLELADNLYDNEITKSYKTIEINKDNFTKLNEIIYANRPTNLSHLSKTNLNTCILRSLEYADSNSFEIVVAKSKNSFFDLIYFWNRGLFEYKYIVYITLDEFIILKNDPYFGKILYQMANSDYKNHITSQSLSKAEIEDVILSFNHLRINKFFTSKDQPEFPYNILDDHGLYGRDLGEKKTVQVLNSSSSIYFIPKLSFIDKLKYNPPYVIDIEIISLPSTKVNYYQSFSSNSDKNYLRYSFTTDTRIFFQEVEGRVNRSKIISIFLGTSHKEENELNLRIPSFDTMINRIISSPIIDGKTIETKFRFTRFNDSSNKLIAFMRLFEDNFTEIESFFGDKFWVDIFEDLTTNDKLAGDAISSFEIIDKFKLIIQDTHIKLGKESETQHNLENLKKGINNTIDRLCFDKVFLRGFKLKCPNCSSIFWYHLSEANDNIKCKGCLDFFRFPIEPNFSYKLNDLIKNNIFQTKKHRDGNLTVIRTLIHYHTISQTSFFFSPQLNLYEDYFGKPITDLDIICMVDGRLVLGECKHSSPAFFEDNSKSLLSLVEVAKAIRPDEVVLSCYEDKNGKLEKAKKSLFHYFNKWEFSPKITILLLHSPDYFDFESHKYFYD